jgi:hypothetical protein
MLCIDGKGPLGPDPGVWGYLQFEGALDQAGGAADHFETHLVESAKIELLGNPPVRAVVCCFIAGPRTIFPRNRFSG